MPSRSRTPDREGLNSSIEPPTRSDEARLLYRAVFGGAAPEVLVERFVGALASAGGVAAGTDAETGDDRLYRRALSTVGDLEALELAARRSGRLTALTRGMRLVVYLAETLPDHQPRFVSRRPRRLRAWSGLIHGGLRSAWKLTRGRALLRRLIDG